jgi:succinate dehydrogenase / fumarate reductase cytochrome b subunit
MASRTGFFSSSVGTKVLIGITGFALFLYLVIHIAGNLLVFFGPAVFNQYAYVMEERNPLLPVIEILLLLVFLVHIYKTVRMFLDNQSARPVRYAQKKPAGRPSRKSLASTTMIVSGLWLLAFLVVHVKAFRFNPVYPWGDGGRDLYRQEFENLSNPFVTGFYVLSMIVVGSHLWHGISSALQSRGVDHPTWTPRVLAAGKVFAVGIAGAFIVIAVWVYFSQAVV